MDKKYAKNGKSKAFLKRNMYYIIMGVCVLAIGAMITVAVLTQKQDPDPVNNDPIVEDPVVEDPVVEDPVVEDPDPIVFSAPVASSTINKDYTMDTVVWWSTLKLYKCHDGIDFGGAENAPVSAVYKGTVSEVGYDALNGNYVKIDHGDGLVTYYGSLSEPVVVQGQTVAAGAVLGNISASATNEMTDGPHVHFSVFKSGAVADPYDYLPEGGK